MHGTRKTSLTGVEYYSTGGGILKGKLFSIITPTYNCESTIAATIKTVLAQNKDLFEYIIVDGLSDDGTLETIKECAAEIKLIAERDNGVYDAMNKGVDVAAGKYLYFLGAGDQLRDGILEKIKPAMPVGSSYFVYGNVYRLDQNRVYDGPFNKSKLNKRNICHQAIFYEKSIFDVVGKFDLRYKTKADFALNLKCFGNKNIKRKYINYVIADYAGFGLSSIKKDEQFMAERPQLVRKHLGVKEFLVYKIRSAYVKRANK
ncbi:MAG: glycosyltransferase family 2 protein [Desulfotomaculaceae bacterium]